MPLTLPFGQAHDAHAWRVGAKAARLSQMYAAGFAVPAGFAVTADALELFLAANSLQAAVAQAHAAFDNGPPEEIPTHAAALRQAVINGHLPDEVAGALRAGVEGLGGGPVAVRSSSSLEDRADLSFAGQHDSQLGLEGFDACAQALLGVWASLWSDRAVAYLRALGIPTTQLRMGVAVQRQVDARAAGVCFTLHPVSGDYQQIQVSAAAGLGEATVSGEVTPDEIVVDREGFEVKTYEATQKNRVLSEAQAAEVARLALRVEAHFGGDPQDIEWAFDAAGLHLLQARPLVVAAGGAWESPIPGAKWKRNWRLGEWLPEAVTPLFSSWVLPKLVAAREQFGTGRLGWDHQPTFSMPHPWFCLVNGYFFTRQDFPGWGEDKDAPPDETPEEKEKRQKEARRKQRREAIDFRRRWHRELIPAYLAHFEEHRRLDLKTCPPRRLLELVEALTEEAGEIWYVIAPIGYGFEENGFKPRYEELIDESQRPHYSVLLSGYPSRIIDGQQALHQLAGRLAADTPALQALEKEEAPPAWLEEALAQYAAEFGHQLKSMDFFFPTAGEDRDHTLSALKALAKRTGPAPDETRARKAAERDAAVNRVLGSLPADSPERAELADLIEYYQTNASIREDANFYLQLGWPLMRQALAQLGRHLREAGALETDEELFFLEKDELFGAVAALETGAPPPPLRQQANGRRRTWQRRRQLEAPDALPVEPETAQEGEEEKKTGYIDDKEGRRFVARAASPGLYRGRVRRIGHTAGAQPLEAGEVLVTYTASPALTPLLLLAGALVVDIGGGASHSSLVARELGLPAVVNTVNGSRILRDGMLVEVDGTAGIVKIIED